MTEGEWLACDDVRALPEFVWQHASDRQVQLAAVACCRRIWHLLDDGRSRAAVEAAERFADGKVTVDQLFDARDAAREALDLGYRNLAPGIRKHVHTAHLRAAWDTAALCVSAASREAEGRAEVNSRDLALIAHWASTAVAHAAFLARRKQVRNRAWNEIVRRETVAQAILLRDVFGNPFRPAVVDPVWSVWNDGTVVKMARVIYDEEQFEDVPLLADALEEAGCIDEEILSHCHGPGPHVRGCWVVDLLLRKE